MIMIISFSLILSAVVRYENARKLPGNPLGTVPVPPLGITDFPCRVFMGIAGMDFLFSISILSLFYLSSKFKQSADVVNAVFAIISAVGFATSMRACFLLKKQVKFRSDLWKWSCDNLKSGISSPPLDFEVTCHVVEYGWKFGLVQASLELLTFIVSVAVFCILKYSYFARYGRFGKIF
ncbi:hypothetical protein HYALB_00013435 [Hymenoscyphus albidus]|uniref:MARVEL domain-containing protein n=1 Tax=Hymenoscyphus albidus TaxID=595503 RepID=A0A9N9Q9G8_9HELO|nr:hypothetical protein HYALB_00013435 [Hymenoscyphus albidus]